MKKILCLIDGLGFGGAQRQIIGLASLLNKKGYETWLASYHAKDFYADLLAKENIKNIVLDNNGSKLSKLKAVKRLTKNEHFDVIIAYQNGPNKIGCFLKFFNRKIKLIVSDRFTREKIGRQERILYNIYRMADIIVPNAYSQEEYIKTNFPFLAKKTFTITNFTDTSFFSPGSEFDFDGNSKEDSTINILIAGRISESKNILKFLDALYILKGRKAAIHVDWFGNIGYGMESYRDQIQKKCRNLQIEDMINFHSGTKNILKEYRVCDVFCLPSIREGFPNTICEAMSCGKPILCSRICDNPQIVEEGINGMLFDPYNAEDIANVIERFTLLSSEERQAMGRNNREKALKFFSENIFVEKYIKLIE